MRNKILYVSLVVILIFSLSMNLYLFFGTGTCKENSGLNKNVILKIGKIFLEETEPAIFKNVKTKYEIEENNDYWEVRNIRQVPKGYISFGGVYYVRFDKKICNLIKSGVYD